jgi:hypothetical protein
MTVSKMEEFCDFLVALVVAGRLDEQTAREIGFALKGVLQELVDDASHFQQEIVGVWMDRWKRQPGLADASAKAAASTN